MNITNTILFPLCLLFMAAPVSAAIMPAVSAVSVPVDSPWALAALGALVAVIVARAIRTR